MREPANIGFYSNLVLLTGLTLSALVPMYFVGSDFLPAASARSDKTRIQPLAVTANAAATNTSQNTDSQNTRLAALYNDITADTPAVLPRQEAEHLQPVAVIPALPMPVGFEGQWGMVSLDDGKVKLNVLKKAYTLGQTRNKAGAEYFDYAAYLFSQMKQQVDDPQLAAQFARLSVEADAMAHHVREASALRFDGTPDENMTHMEVRTGILYHLNGLNPHAMHVVDVDEQGRNITPEGEKVLTAHEQGRTLARFANTMRDLANNPVAREQYPQTLRVMSAQADALERLAMNLELRWESVFKCEGMEETACTHQQTASRMRIYATQTATPSTIQLATADAIYQWLGYTAVSEI